MRESLLGIALALVMTLTGCGLVYPGVAGLAALAGGGGGGGGKPNNPPTVNLITPERTIDGLIDIPFTPKDRDGTPVDVGVQFKRDGEPDDSFRDATPATGTVTTGLAENVLTFFRWNYGLDIGLATSSIVVRVTPRDLIELGEPATSQPFIVGNDAPLVQIDKVTGFLDALDRPRDQSGNVAFKYTLFDSTQDLASVEVTFTVTLDDGPATATATTRLSAVSNLLTADPSETGAPFGHTFIWASKDDSPLFPGGPVAPEGSLSKDYGGTSTLTIVPIDRFGARGAKDEISFFLANRVIDRIEADLVLADVDGPSVALVVPFTDPQTQATGTQVVFQGDGGALTALVVNQGLAPTAVDFDVAWFLSRTKAVDDTSFRVKRAVLSASQVVDTGEARRVSRSDPMLVEPVGASTLTPGRYFLLARVNERTGLIELDDANNERLSATTVEVYAEGAGFDRTNLDFAITDVQVPTAVRTGALAAGSIVLTNLNAPVPFDRDLGVEVVLSTDATIDAQDLVIATTTITFPASGAAGARVATPIDFAAETFSGRARIGIRLMAATFGLALGDAVAANNTRLSELDTFFHAQSVLFDNGTRLPGTSVTRLDIVSQRPADSTVLNEGGQRILAFELPAGAGEVLQNQCIIHVASTEFDPVCELLSPSGATLRIVDDLAGDKRAVLYARLVAPPENPIFFLVVGAHDGRGSGAFTVSVSVNDEVAQHDVGDLAATVDGVLDPSTEVEMPFDFRVRENEFFFSIPASGRCGLLVRSQQETATLDDDVFLDPVASTLVRFDEQGVPSDMPIVLQRDVLLGRTRIASALDFDGRFDLPPGEYVLVVRSQLLPIPLDQPFELVFDQIVFDRRVAAGSQ